MRAPPVALVTLAASASAEPWLPPSGVRVALEGETAQGDYAGALALERAPDGGALRARLEPFEGAALTATCRRVPRHPGLFRGAVDDDAPAGLADRIRWRPFAGAGRRLVVRVEPGRARVRVHVFSGAFPRLLLQAEGLLPLQVLGAAIPREDVRRGPGTWAEAAVIEGDPDPEEVAAEAAAAATPPVPGDLGGVVVLVPAIFDEPPGLAYVARVAAYADRVVIVRLGPGRDLRPLAALDGRDLPPELAGRVFTSSDAASGVTTLGQASDRLLEVLDAIERSPDIGVDLRREGVTVIGHCQGGLAALLARKRLSAAGRGAAIRRLVALGLPSTGVAIPAVPAVEVMAGALTPLSPHLRAALIELRPARVAAWLEESDRSLVDLALAGHQPGSDPPSDGLVDVAGASFGVRVRVLEAGSHRALFRDPRVIDAAAAGLADAPAGLPRGPLGAPPPR